MIIPKQGSGRSSQGYFLAFHFLLFLFLIRHFDSDPADQVAQKWWWLAQKRLPRRRLSWPWAVEEHNLQVQVRNLHFSWGSSLERFGILEHRSMVWPPRISTFWRN